MPDVSAPVLFFANGLGDSVLSLPAIRAIAAQFDGALTLVTQHDLGTLFFRDIRVRRLIELPMWRTEDGRAFDVELAARRIGRCDLWLSLVPWTSPSLLALTTRLRPRVSVGFFDNYSVTLPLDYGRHSADLTFDVARWLNPALHLEDFAAPPLLSAHRARARAYRALLPRGARLLAVHNETLPDKVWPAARLGAALQQILRVHDDLFVWHLAAHPPPPMDLADCSERVLPIVGVARGLAMALAAESDYFLGVDSCMLHVADFSGVPGVGLFGPTRPHEFGYRLSPHVHVDGRGEMTRIPVHRVTQAFARLVARQGQRRTDAIGVTASIN